MPSPGRLPSEAVANPPDGTPLSYETIRARIVRVSSSKTECSLVVRHADVPEVVGRLSHYNWDTDSCSVDLSSPRGITFAWFKREVLVVHSPG